MDVISLLVFVILILVSFKFKVNMGVLAFSAALILGRIIGMEDGEIIKTLSSSLFVSLTGITLLFAAVSSTKAFEYISNKIVSLCGEKIWILPLVTYFLGFILAAIGPGAIPPTTLVVTLAVSIALATNYNPIMMGVIGGLGLMGGRVAPFTPEGSLVASLAKTQGIDKDIILPVMIFQIVTTMIMGIILYFAFGGHKVKNTNYLSMKNNEKPTKNMIISLLSILIMLIIVVGFGVNVGLVSFLIASLLFIFGVAEDREAIKAIPWHTILMVLGVGTLMSVVSSAGGIELLTNILSKIMNSTTVAPFMGITAGLMSFVSSGLGVVYPTLIPMASNLAQTVGGNPIAIISAIVAGGSLAGFSPMSTNGALTLSTMVTLKKDMTKEEETNSFFRLILIAIACLIWVGISSAIFGNLIVRLFG